MIDKPQRPPASQQYKDAMESPAYRMPEHCEWAEEVHYLKKRIAELEELRKQQTNLLIAEAPVTIAENGITIAGTFSSEDICELKWHECPRSYCQQYKTCAEKLPRGTKPPEGSKS